MGEHFIIPTGSAKFKGLVKNNETAAFIVDCLKTETTEKEIVDKLLERYSGVDRATVEKDVAELVSKFRGIGALEG